MKSFKEFLSEGINDKGILKAIFLGGTPGAGKAQPLNSKILSDSGWVEMGNINVGDYVITPDNRKCKVNEIHPQGKIDVYEIEMFDGRKTKCSGEHLWKVHGFTVKKNEVGKRDWTIRDTNELFQKQNKTWLKNRLHLPLPKPLDLKREYDDNLDVHPYLLGILLGDGCFRGRRVSFTSIDNEVIEKCSKVLNEGYELKNYRISYYIKRKELEKGKNDYINFLKDSGMMNCFSHEKYIPENYKNSSIQDRLELLRGLFDSDGYVSKTGSVYFYTTSKKLMEDVRYLIWSLGDISTLKIKKTKYKNNSDKYINCRDCYVIHLQSHNPEKYFYLERKKNRASLPLQKNNLNHNLKNRIKSIKYIGKEECQCITINNDEGLYITDNFIVTHNSYTSKKLKSGQIEPKLVNIDKYLEFLAFHLKRGDISDAHSDEFKALRQDARMLTKNEMINFVNGMLPLIVDGTASKTKSVLKRTGILEYFGYDTGMIWVNTTLETSLARARKRKRDVPEEFIREVFEIAEENKKFYRSQFSFFLEINNNDGELTDDVIKKAFTKTMNFFTSPNKNPVGKENIEKLRKEGGKELVPTIHDLSDLKSNVEVWFKSK